MHLTLILDFSWGNFPERLERINPRRMPIAPRELKGVATNELDVEWVNIGRKNDFG